MQYIIDSADTFYNIKESVSFKSKPEKYIKKNKKTQSLRKVIRGKRVYVCSPRGESCEEGGFNIETERYYIETATKTKGLIKDFESNSKYIEQNIKVIDNRFLFHSYGKSCILGYRRRY